MLRVTILFKTGAREDWFAEKAFSHAGNLVMRNGCEPLTGTRRFTSMDINLDAIASWTVTQNAALPTLAEARVRRHE